MPSNYNCYITNLNAIENGQDDDTIHLFLSKRRRSSTETLSSVSSHSTFVLELLDEDEDKDEQSCFSGYDDEETLYYDSEGDDNHDDDDSSVSESSFYNEDDYTDEVWLDDLNHQHSESSSLDWKKEEQLEDTTVGSCDFGDSSISIHYYYYHPENDLMEEGTSKALPQQQQPICR